MSWGVGTRVGVAIGLGSIATFFSSYGRNQEFNNLILKIILILFKKMAHLS
jgi:hypothetical protein